MIDIDPAIIVKPVKILKASAGSGKTHSLTGHYLNLLFSSSGNTKYREILAVTFTKKATQEMKSRILESLKNIALGEASKDFEHSILDQFPQMNSQSLKEKAKNIYRQILHDYSRFSVSTIDSFVQKVIRGFTFELGLEPGFKVVVQKEGVKKEILKKLNQSLDSNPELLKYCIQIALDRIKEDKPWDFNQALYSLTENLFKEEYLQHESAINKLSIQSDSELIFKKYEDLCLRTQKKFKSEINRILQKAIEVYDSLEVKVTLLKGQSNSYLTKLNSFKNSEFKLKDRDRFKLLFGKANNSEEWFKDLNQDNELYANLNPILAELKNFYEKEIENFLLVKKIGKNMPLLRLLHQLYSMLKEYREESGDLFISDSQRLLEGISGPNSGNPYFVWEKIGNRFRNFLLDEFQDTSQSQWNNFVPLIRDSIATSPSNKVNNLLVGDLKQSIFRFRNGDWSLLHQKAQQDLGLHNVFSESLPQNYRSHLKVIEFNNQVFSQIPKILQSQINHQISESSPIEIQEWWKENGNSTIIEDIYQGSNQEKTSQTPLGGSVHIQLVDLKLENQEEDEETKVTIFKKSIQEIKRLIKDYQFTYSDIGILVETNAEARLVINELLENNIPAVSGDSLLIGNNKVVTLVLNTFRFFNGIKENVNLYLANCIALFSEIKGEHFPADRLLNLKNTPENLKGKLPDSILENSVSWLSLPLSELYERIIEAYSLQNLEPHISYLLGFRDLLDTFSKTGEEGLNSFLAWWDEEGTLKGLSSGNHPNAVQISTIFKSKGLAYRAVFIPFCNWSLKGSVKKEIWINTRGTDFEPLFSVPVGFSNDLAETKLAKQYYEELLNSYLDALNILYVSLTRAKEHLYISINSKSIKELESKKTENEKYINKIGGLLISSLKSSACWQEDELGNSVFIWEDENLLFLPQNKLVKENNNFLKIFPYPISSRLSYQTGKESLVSKNRFKQEKEATRGSLLHEILSKLDHPEQLDSILLSFKNSGRLMRRDIPELKNKIENIINHPELLNLFFGAINIFSERNIFEGQGKVSRPDKVIFFDKGVNLLDYKFTNEEKPEHHKQVLDYADLLGRMGYGSIKSYLFYANFNRLVQVQ